MNLAEGVQVVSFGILAIMMIVAALGVVLLNNIVYSAFLLGGVFISISGLYVLLNADFVAAAQILIYVGAINVLILFAIMLVNKQENYAPVANRWLRSLAAGLVCLGVFALLGTMVVATDWQIPATTPVQTLSSVVKIGQHFFSDFLLPFELASVLLLMAMVGAIVLARRDFLPDDLSLTNQTTSFTLPEKSKELASLGSKKN